ncbi:hypothetical protein QO004_004025 [Rhizobium mesoamericanum]|nr:hypothetical protein [Rhizobium mesoamericanum]
MTAFRSGSKAKAKRHWTFKHLDAQFLHVRVFGALESVDLRPSQSKPLLAKQHQVREQFNPNIGWKVCDLAFEAVVKLDLPFRHFIT